MNKSLYLILFKKKERCLLWKIAFYLVITLSKSVSNQIINFKTVDVNFCNFNKSVIIFQQKVNSSHLLWLTHIHSNTFWETYLINVISKSIMFTMSSINFNTVYCFFLVEEILACKIKIFFYITF